MNHLFLCNLKVWFVGGACHHVLSWNVASSTAQMETWSYWADERANNICTRSATLWVRWHSLLFSCTVLSS